MAQLKSDLLAEDAATKTEEYLVDISDVEQVRQAAKQVEEDLGPIDCLVNNAGRINQAPFLMKNGSTEVRNRSYLSKKFLRFFLKSGMVENSECEYNWESQCHLNYLSSDGSQEVWPCC